jgi:hypothetical protein
VHVAQACALTGGKVRQSLLHVVLGATHQEPLNSAQGPAAVCLAAPAVALREPAVALHCAVHAT